MTDEEGLQVPLFQSLTQPVLYGGVPKTAAIVVWTAAVVLALPLGYIIIGLGFGAITQAVLAYFTKRDRQFLEVMQRHLHQPSFWT